MGTSFWVERALVIISWAFSLASLLWMWKVIEEEQLRCVVS